MWTNTTKDLSSSERKLFKLRKILMKEKLLLLLQSHLVLLKILFSKIDTKRRSRT